MNGLRKWGVTLMFASTLAAPLFAPTLAFATEGTNVSTVGTVEQVSPVENQSDAAVNNVLNSGGTTAPAGGTIGMEDIDGSTYIPDTTIEDANQWVSDKGDDLVGLGGTVAEPLAIIGFMLGLFITLAGAFTRSSHLGKGLLVMAISIIVYVGAVFAPDLVQYFSTWLAS